MQLRTQAFPTRHQNTQVVFGISALDIWDNDLNLGGIPALFGCRRKVSGHFPPEATQAIDPADLLFAYGRIPFWMEH
ncbi:hypothetical protein SKA58_16958 [Sphingomonas sp. SKA58]|nr:hypothetical protein SKA58_16958 [Sphingomonas sp. SKA58]